MLKNLLVQPVFAEVEPVTPLTGVDSLGDLVNYVANALVIVGFAVVIIFLAIGFLRYVTSQGEKTAVENAQKTLTYAVIGGVGLVLIYTLKTILINLLGIEDTTNQDAFGNETN